MSQTARYEAQIHRLQSVIRWGISRAMLRGLNPDLDGIVPDQHMASPKHLRVGVEYAEALIEAVTRRADDLEMREQPPPGTPGPQLRFG